MNSEKSVLAYFSRCVFYAGVLGGGVLFSGIAKADSLTMSVNGVIEVRPSCIINSGSTENVSFGEDLLSTHLDGLRYAKDIPLTIICTGPVRDINLWLTGAGASFDAKVLRTDLTDLGIRFLKEDNSQLDLEEKIDIVDPSAPARIRAAPVKASDTGRPVGAFTATATLMVEVT